MVQGWYTALERTMFLNHCSDAHLKYWEANLATHYKGLRNVVQAPAITCLSTHMAGCVCQRRSY